LGATWTQKTKNRRNIITKRAAESHSGDEVIMNMEALVTDVKNVHKGKHFWFYK